MALSAAPDALVDELGAPRLGAYAGRMRDTSLARLTGSTRREGLRRLASEKRWHYACAASDELFVSGAIVQLGYLGNGFFSVFDRRERRMLAEHSLMVPSQLVELDDLAAEARARLRRLRSSMLIEASARAGRVAFDSRGVSVEIWLRPETAPPPLTAVCPVPGGGVTMTQKTACVPCGGEVRVQGRVLRLEGALACLDYSHGYLARETRWRWASASGRLGDGRAVGLNLVEGHNDGAITENALWIDGRLSQPGHASFDFDERAPERPWRLRTDDGRVQLAFQPEGLRREDTDLRLIFSHYLQVVGTFAGELTDESGEKVRVERLPGVVERHHARW